MKNVKRTLLVAALALAVAPVQTALGADSASQAAVVKEKIQSLRSGCAAGRTQITAALEELNRLMVPGVDLRPQFEKYKAELAKVQVQAAAARERADSMKAKGQSFFDDWEAQIKTIQNDDIRKEAANRLNKRKKSYDKIIAEMQDAKETLVPFLSDLNDIKTLLDTELTAKSVSSSKSLVRKANRSGADAREALTDVETELDRVSAELATYQ
jgi:hypothetical protein